MGKVTVKNTRKPYITPVERKQQQRQFFKKFCFELFLKREDRNSRKN